MNFFKSMFGLTLASFALAWPLYLVAVVSFVRQRTQRVSAPLGRSVSLTLLVPLALPYWTAFTLGPNELMPASADTEFPMRVLGILAMLAILVHVRIWWTNRASRKLNALCAVAALLCTGTAYIVGAATLTNSWP